MTRSTTDEAAVPPLPSPKERRRLREAKSLSEEEVAAAVGVTRATVRSWETGRTSPRGRKRALYAKLIAPEPAVKPPVVTAEAAAVVATSAAADLPEAPPLPEAPSPAAPPSDPPPAPMSDPRTGAVAADDRSRTAEVPGRPSGTAEAPDERRASPAEAFDELYARTAPGLVRQTYLLTGRRALARESVERAFELAWQRWPEVAVDRDPAGWVRAAAYEYAMSPWHRLRRTHRHPDAPPTEPGKRALFDALLDLPPAYRRTLLLYDGVGLDLPETAAETEASTPAAAGRLMTARAAVAERLPELADAAPAEQSALLQDRLGGLARAEHVPVPRPARAVRTGSESKAKLWTRAAVAGVALLIAVTGLTLHTAPTHYEQPISPPERVGGVPPRGGPQKLTAQDLKLQKSLNEQVAHGPERLVPQLE
ncbi:helix-turn-helix domain-containing protein [Streptomyces globisporus]|uniref:helix-turn-helix domain-containing protein n=1 Tax=Streptomyces globisporus TaxID=1908 RepID=UPI0005C8AD05|nr:helix-turn-helix domain-containing protein [Streptomyces globisporus]AWL86559.1 helix-turn-helix domain-containing protein [Streptomyces globisporus]PPA40389.1 DNA-directed RNA polymerase sigma-70 factor [Streptomyces griseus]RAN17747.1 XRE family transcriptional regulator [Streptomyces badius]RAN25624.1 XRE family transcriptional regulator [Streptomyces badius]